MNNEEDQKRLDIHTEAVMKLAQQLVVNNNTVSGAMRLMSENLEEVVSMSGRVEDKLDGFLIENAAHEKNWDTKTCELIKETIKQINDTGFLKFLKLAKTVLIAVGITIVVSGLIYLGKTIITAFHIINKLGSGG
jgi:hypothetical protein